MEISEDGTNYFLPKDLRPVYCSSAAPLLTGFVPIIAGPFENVMDCFKKNGPAGILPESSKVDEIADGTSEMEYNWEMLKDMIFNVPGLFRQLEAGISVLEVGSGGGIALHRIAAHFPNSRFVGTDIASKYVDAGNKMAREEGLKNITFQIGDVTALPNDWDNKFDYVFCMKVIHDIWKPGLALKEIFRVLKPGHHFSMIEINLHSNVRDNIDMSFAAFNYCISLNHCMATALATPGAEGVGAGWGKENMKAALEVAGFSDISFHETGNPILVHVVSKKRM